MSERVKNRIEEEEKRGKFLSPSSRSEFGAYRSD